ncbi:hypothetical protein FE848_15440 [Marinobacter sp. 1-3A]|uniref:hypothetical protein n=1 Tax=Marinobacter sp. 1-3A TaxID=2582920 RepID=UPI001908529D|nr:hypothetical protein [Marinobacter sp. 1-3A]MBK1874619.1 hypothetical protein [Marinobacter sp. 1-3A]
MDNQKIVESLINGLENLRRNATDEYDRGYIKAMLGDANRLLTASIKDDIPKTRLKCAGMIDLYDEDEPGNKETVQYGLVLEFPTREAMAEAFEKGICRYSFGFEVPKPTTPKEQTEQEFGEPTVLPACPECGSVMNEAKPEDPLCEIFWCGECGFNEPSEQEEKA